MIYISNEEPQQGHPIERIFLQKVTKNLSEDLAKDRSELIFNTVKYQQKDTFKNRGKHELRKSGFSFLIYFQKRL